MYASGDIENDDRGGIIGRIHSGANEIEITMSVHNGGQITGSAGSVSASRNSNDLGSITGKVYCDTEGICWDTSTIWKETGDLPMLLAEISPSASPTGTCTPSVTSTSTSTRTATRTSTQTPYMYMHSSTKYFVLGARTHHVRENASKTGYCRE